MFLKFLLVLACGVLPASVFADIVIQKLTEEVESARKETNYLNEDSAGLTQKLDQMNQEYEDRVFNIHTEQQNNSVEVKSELEKLKTLNSDIAKHKQDLETVKSELALYNKLQRKMNLGLKWLEKNIANLESMRRSGEDKQCNNVLLNKELLVAKERALANADDEAQKYSSSNETVEDTNSASPDDVISLAHILKTEKAKLVTAKDVHNTVLQKIKEKSKYWNSIEEVVKSTMTEINGDLEKAKATVKETEGEFEEIKTELTTARQQLESKINEKKQQTDRVLQIKKALQEFGHDTACYTTIEREVLQSIESHP